MFSFFLKAAEEWTMIHIYVYSLDMCLDGLYLGCFLALNYCLFFCINSDQHLFLQMFKYTLKKMVEDLK